MSLSYIRLHTKDRCVCRFNIVILLPITYVLTTLTYLCNKQPEWTKRVWKAEFFVHYVKKGFYYIEKTNRGVGGQKLNTTLPNRNILLLRPSKSSGALKKGSTFGFLTSGYALKN